jgi:hypothetical protein
MKTEMNVIRAIAHHTTLALPGLHDKPVTTAATSKTPQTSASVHDADVAAAAAAALVNFSLPPFDTRAASALNDADKEGQERRKEGREESVSI